MIARNVSGGMSHHSRPLTPGIARIIPTAAATTVSAIRSRLVKNTSASVSGSRRPEARAEPSHLPPVVDFVLDDVKPRKVRIHGWRSRKRPVEPCVIPIGKTCKRASPYFGKLVQVVLERLATKTVARRGPEGERRFPRCLFVGSGLSILERETLIAALRGSQVSEQRAD